MQITRTKRNVTMSSLGGTEKVLESVGGFGLYQVKLCFIVGYLVVFCTAVLMVMTFSTAEPPWKCTLNSTSCTLNGTFKLGDENFDHRCKLQRSDWEFVVEGDFNSIVTEWDLVCDTAVYVSIANSTVFILWILGSMVASIVSDKFGRKTVVYPSAFFACLCGFISSFAQTYWVFAVFRALAGIGIGAYSICGFVLVMEYTGSNYRSRVGFGIWYFWIFGLMFLALLGYLIPDWRTLSIITSAPGVLIFICWWLSPESLRWLLVKGRTEQAIKTLRDVARVNKKHFSEENVTLIEKSYMEREEKQKLGNIKDLFASRAIAYRTLISWYCWGVSGLVYYGISLSTPSVGGNMYLNFFISALCEGIAMVIGMYLLDRFGRKKTIVVNVWLAGLVMVIGALLNFFDDGSDGYTAGKVISSMVLGKTFITIVFDGVYVYSSELFPTVVRNTAMGTSTSAARIGSAMAPYIVYSERVHPLMPFSFMAVAAVVCGILCLLLPETNKTSMPDTVQQVNGGTKNEKDNTLLEDNFYKVTTWI